MDTCRHCRVTRVHRSYISLNSDWLFYHLQSLVCYFCHFCQHKQLFSANNGSGGSRSSSKGEGAIFQKYGKHKVKFFLSNETHDRGEGNFSLSNKSHDRGGGQFSATNKPHNRVGAALRQFFVWTFSNLAINQAFFYNSVGGDRPLAPTTAPPLNTLTKLLATLTKVFFRDHSTITLWTDLVSFLYFLDLNLSTFFLRELVDTLLGWAFF